MIDRFLAFLTRAQKRRILLALDGANAVLAFLIAWALVSGHVPSLSEIVEAVRFPVILLPVTLVLTLAFGLHRTKLNAYELQSMLESIAIAISLGLVGLVINDLPGLVLPDQTFIILSMAYAILSVGVRLFLRWAATVVYTRGRARKRVIIYGAGRTGQQLAVALKTDDTFVPVAFVDESPAMQGLTIGGLKVMAPSAIPDLVQVEGIDLVILAMPSASPATRAVIMRRLAESGCRVQSIPSFSELLIDGSASKRPMSMVVTDFLGRDTFCGSIPEVNGAYSRRNVLVTGAGGSIGTELCRQLLRSGPTRLVMLDHSELALYNIDRELQTQECDTDIVSVLGSVTDAALMRRIMHDHDIDVVLHAAAYKHLPMVESNPASGLANNVLGTRVAAEAALEAGVDRFILVSSDKAVRPASVMGASKRMAELVVQEIAARSAQTRFSMVRFGNVLGSSGSILPLFQEQINAGGPVTVTDRRASRYFMTIPEAVSLVLLAGTFARGGEVFVLDMGKPILIQDLAENMIRNLGLTVRDAEHPEGDIEIVEIGLRPGEKLHEELLIGSDMLTTPHPKILRAQEGALGHAALEEMLADLQQAIADGDEAAMRAVITRWLGSEQRYSTWPPAIAAPARSQDDVQGQDGQDDSGGMLVARS